MARTIIDVRELTRVYHVGDVSVRALAGLTLTRWRLPKLHGLEAQDQVLHAHRMIKPVFALDDHSEAGCATQDVRDHAMRLEISAAIRSMGLHKPVRVLVAVRTPDEFEHHSLEVLICEL